MTRLSRLLAVLALVVAAFGGAARAAAEIRLATFRADVTPPLGSPLCDALCPPATAVSDPLSARGVILQTGDDDPVVLLAVDWVGIGNEGYRAWRSAVAEACRTPIDRVRLHCLHQHDAPGCDFAAEEMAAEAGLPGKLFPVEFSRTAIARVAQAAGAAVDRMTPVTQLSYGLARVEQVASNRRILGADGKVKAMRLTACKDAQVRAEPEGVIDPNVRLVGFWNGDRPLAVLTFFATHPQSYYGAGVVSADFVGLARDRAAEAEGTGLHVHFNGAGGNVGAGKYNDGSPENRPQLAERLAAGMLDAWRAARRISAADLAIRWTSESILLPVAPWYDEAMSRAELNDLKAPEVKRLQAARAVAWGRRCEAGETIDVGRLRIGPIDVLSLPGEMFVEYQLAAQKMRPESFVCVAAYGDYGPGYVGTAIAYSQGGYETGVASRVGSRSETVLMTALENLLR